MATNSEYVGAFRDEILTLTPEFATRPRVLWKPKAVGSAAVRGSRVHAIYASSNDNGANTLQLIRGKLRTVQDAVNTGAMSITGNNAINRAAGSFVADGWRVGMRCMLEDPTTIGNGVVAYVAGVTALALTFAAATFPTNESIPAGTAVIQLGQMAVVGTQANTGFGEAVRAVPLLTSTAIPALAQSPDTCTVLGANSCLLAAVTTTLTAGEVVEVIAEGGDY